MSTQETGAERRKHTRVVLKATVNMHSNSNFYTGFSDNISEGGLFVATHQVLAIGSRVKLDFSLPDHGKRLEMDAEVRWIRRAHADDESEPGIGLQFVEMSADNKLIIDTFIKSRETLFFDAE